MNSEQAKKLSLPDLLSRLGHEPVKSVKGGRELWYASPFRTEKDPSFHTSFLGGKWIWNDFGDIGGTVIDFVMRYQNFSRVSDALRFLERIFPGSLFDPGADRVGQGASLFSFQQQTADEPEGGRSLEYISSGKIGNNAIYNYLERVRKIPAHIADKYLKEVRYRNLGTGKEYFAFGMENLSGGFEIRVATDEYVFKSALIARDVSLLRGSSKARAAVSVFEGMTDFLSLLVMLGTDHLAGDALVMHSLSSFGRALEVIKTKGYETVYTFLDNNRPGQEHTERFIAELGSRAYPRSLLFSPHIDLNDALRSGSRLDFSRLDTLEP